MVMLSFFSKAGLFVLAAASILSNALASEVSEKRRRTRNRYANPVAVSSGKQLSVTVPHSIQQIEVLVYETESNKDTPATKLVEQLQHIDGIKATLVGQGQSFDGFGSKYAAVYPFLSMMEPDTLVVLSDGRDVLINNPMQSKAYSALSVQEFRDAYNEITKDSPNAIVVSAEAQCCVSALTHVALGGYFNADGSRNGRSCSSGEADCMWAGDDKALPWETYMKTLAIERTDSHYDDVYLNAGLMVGTVKNMIRTISSASIAKNEDDQGVLTDFMYHHPDLIILDYGQTMFGNNHANGSCTFDVSSTGNERLVHSKTGTSPLFVHSPGDNFKCHDPLADKLGVTPVAEKSRRLDKKKNYRPYRRLDKKKNYRPY